MKLRRKLRNVPSYLSFFKLFTARLQLAQCYKDYNKTEDHLKALQSVGQIIGEVLKQLDDSKCIILQSFNLTY